MTDRASALQPLIIVAVVAAAHLSLFPRMADLDGFYHIGHALSYLEGSFFDTSLPWATRSVIGDVGGDLWWGFHVVLAPLAALAGVEWGMRLGALLLTGVLAWSVHWVLRRHGVDHAAWWTTAFLVAVPNVLFRHVMLRPHVLSLAASVALVSVLVRGRWWQIVLLCAGISWIHLSLFWLGPVIAAVYAVTRVPVTVVLGADPDDRGVPLRLALPAAVAGAVLGWLLRPDPLTTASLLNVQLLELLALKALALPVTFAGELAPLGMVDLGRMAGSFLAAWLAALAMILGVAMVPPRPSGASAGEDELASVAGDADTASGESTPHRAPGRGLVSQETATLVATASVLSLLFLVVALVSARRAMEQWVAFGFLVLPFAWRAWRHRWAPAFRAGSWTRAGLLVVLTLHLAWFGWRHALNVTLVAFPADTLEEAATFLEENSQPGDVVFHARWDNFGPLFARNRTNHYLGGMDPVFLYAHDATSYWEFFFLSADATTEWTCDAFPCADGTATDTHLALRDHFGARWIVVEPVRNPRLSLYLLDDPRYELALDAQHSAVFEILP